jgi:hypothetical protein
MKVGEEDVVQTERHPVTHHLPLRALAAVEQQRLSLAHDGERRNVALDRGTRRGGAEQAEGERHGGAIYSFAAAVLGCTYTPRAALPHPLREHLDQPEKVAPAHVLFASNADNSYITGEVLTLLGGEQRAA